MSNKKTSNGQTSASRKQFGNSARATSRKKQATRSGSSTSATSRKKQATRSGNSARATSRKKQAKRSGNSARATSRKKQATGAKARGGPVETAVGRQMNGMVDMYTDLALEMSRSACVMRPIQYTGHQRRLHVRNTILEDHATRIDEKAEGAEAKFDKLAGSLFSFFRGTNLLFHRDMAGEDGRMPTVLALGDVHPENFGVTPNANNVPIFANDDFDDVAYAPFTWDLKRGATGFMVAAADKGGHGAGKQRKIARQFVKGYAEGIDFYARSETESKQEFRHGNSPKIIRKLLKDSSKSRRSWLWKRYLDETGQGFPANEEFTPISGRRDEFQELIDQLAERNSIERGGRAGDLVVKDVTIRHGQGTASLGLHRYYVLLEGPLKDATDDLIIEFKRARRSALHGLMPGHDFNAGEAGERIAHGQSVHLAKGDVFYGDVQLDGMSFMTRERAPFRDEIDLESLKMKGWKRYAHACGLVLAQAHARSDDAGQLDYDIEPAIRDAMQPVELFIDDVLCFAAEAAERLARDHAAYRRDHELGAFENMLKSYR